MLATLLFTAAIASEGAPPAADEVAETVVVRGDRQEAPDPDAVPGSVSVIEVDETLPASTDVATALEAVSGTAVQRLGGLGDFSAVSIRGAGPRQVEVTIDGVPLNPDGATVVDLSELPLRSFERVEVYRSAAPGGQATAAGGVVNLVTPDDPAPPSVALTAGSHRTSRLHADVHPAWAGARGLLSVDGLTTGGGFTYFDDRNTPYNLADDRLQERENNDTHQLSAVGRVQLGDDRLRLTVLDSALARDEGVPGPIGAPTRTVRYGILRNLAAVHVDAAGDDLSGQGRVWVQVREERFDDRQGEIGVGRQHTRDTTTAVGARASAQAGLGGGLVTGATAELRLDRYLGRDLLAGTVHAPRHRLSATAAAHASLRAWGDRVLVEPLLQAQWLESIDADRTSGGEAASTVALTPRLGVLVRPGGRLVLKGTVGRYLRPPDFLELFGDRGAFVGRPDLRPEQGWQGDLGLRWTAPAAWPVTGSVEGAAFHRVSTDLIAYVQTGQRVVTPMNLGAAAVTGGEGTLALRGFDRVDLHASVTRTWSVNRSSDEAYAGNRLPRVPGWDLSTRAGLLFGERARVGHTLWWSDGEYWDATNWYRAAPRTLHGVYGRLALTGAWSVEGEILNLGDDIAEVVPRNPLDPGNDARVLQSITDFAGYPLPGRTFLVTLRWAPRRPE